ncbi:MAG TPA: FtsX-like permease family protein, partial [Cellulomonas sp.]
MTGLRASRALSSWRVAARIARRDAVRARGRTALVVTMVGLPVLAGMAGGTLVQSSVATQAQKVAWEMGPQEQAVVSPFRGPGVEQSADGGVVGARQPASTQDLPTLADYEAGLAAALPRGDRLVRSVEGTGRVRTTDAVAQGERPVRELPAADMADVVAAPVEAGALPSAPGEVAVAHDLASELDVHVGDAISVTWNQSAPVDLRVSAVLAPWPTFDEVYAVSGALFPAVGSATGALAVTGWFVVGKAPVTWQDVTTVNALGSSVRSRAVMLDPSGVMTTVSSGNDLGVTSGMVVIGAAVVAMALIEAVLLIGPAFAVGARRSQRQLALLAATGAERSLLRRVVLLGGLVVGLGASVVGAALGVVVAAVVRTVVVARGSFALPALRVPWWAAAVLVVLGTAVATVAAAVPARRASRVDVVAALAGRRADARPHRATPVVGIVVAAAGVVAALAGATTRQATLIVGGVIGLELGLVFASGALVSLVGMLAPRLGIAGRIAARDAVRQRGRTAPALAAVIAALAGLTAGVVFLESQMAQERTSYSPLGAVGTVALGMPPVIHSGDPVPSLEDLSAAAGVLRADLPVSDVAFVRFAEPAGLRSGAGSTPTTSSEPAAPGVAAAASPVPPSVNLQIVRSPSQECPPFSDTAPIVADSRCVLGGGGAVVWWPNGTYSHWLVDDGTVVRMLGLSASGPAADALAAGKVVVNSVHDLQEDGTVHLQVLDATGAVTADARFPAVVADLENISEFGAALPPSAADRLGLRAAVEGLVATTTRRATTAEVAAADADMDGRFTWGVYDERGPRQDAGPVIWALVAVAIALGLAATGVAVALAAAESRPDLATLGAVGAAPRMRRRIAAAQAGVLAVTGAVLGVVAGILLARVLVTAEVHAEG